MTMSRKLLVLILLIALLSETLAGGGKKGQTDVKPSQRAATVPFETLTFPRGFPFSISCTDFFYRKNKGFGMRWFRNGQEIKRGDPIKKIDGYLYFSRAKFSHAGNYSCLTSVQGEKVSKYFKVVVKKTKPGLPFFLDIPLRQGGTRTVTAGGTIRLSCPFHGVPQPTIEWFFNEEPLNITNRKVEVVDVVSPNDTLLIHESLLWDGGLYQCVITNSFGSINATRYIDVDLDFYIPPNCRSVAETVYVHPDRIGKDVEIKCDCDNNNPRQTRFEKLIPNKPDCEPTSWDDKSCGPFVNFEGLNQSGGIDFPYRFVKEDMNAIIAEFHENDTGIYRCRVVNELGWQGTLYHVVLGYDYNQTLYLRLNNATFAEHSSPRVQELQDDQISLVLIVTSCTALLIIAFFMVKLACTSPQVVVETRKFAQRTVAMKENYNYENYVSMSSGSL